MHVFFSVGEPSGDQHAAHLIHELRRRHPNLQVSGLGGPRMQQAGCQLLYRLTDLAVMGFLRVVPLLWTFYQVMKQAEQFFAQQKPDAVVLIDFPGFNWWIARKAKAAGIPVFYYMPPQLWAWAPWRIRKVRKYVDYVLSGLTFERDWYVRRGIQAEYVGHPFFDEVADAPLDQEFCHRWTGQNDSAPVVAVLPGSRNHEVAKNWPLMLEAMRQVHARHPRVRFLVANYKEAHREFCQTAAAAEYAGLPLEYCVGKTSEIIEVADCGLMVSGSVSLELLARATPAVVIYRCSPLAYPLMRLLVRVDSATLPNLIAGRSLFPEFLVVRQPQRDVRAMADILNEWLADEPRRAAVVAQLRRLRDEVAKPGATGRTADAILARLPLQAQRHVA